MIAVFPEPYPDELLYSTLARYFVYSGHSTFKQCSEDLYQCKTRPDIEYLNRMTPDLLSHLGDVEQIILQHTMFPSLRFIPSVKRQQAYQLLLQQDNRYQDFVFKPKERRVLRYCPMCATEDRQRYGETYWHRIPQIHGLTVCPMHHVLLKESNIPIYSKEAGSLLPAEAYVASSDIVQCCDRDLDNKLADFVAEVFAVPVQFDEILIGDYLRQQAKAYRSPSGKSIRSKKLFQDFRSIFPNSPITEDWQIRKIFNGFRFDLVEICQLAIVLGVTSEELLSVPRSIAEPPEKQNNVRFRSYDTDWDGKDMLLLPAVERIVKKMLSAEPPMHLTVGSIARYAGISRSTIDRGRLPLCLGLMKQYSETQETYWARKLEWAYQITLQQQLPLHKTQLRKLTNIEFMDMQRAIPYVRSTELVIAISS